MPKLVYFNAMGRAQQNRFLLAYKGVPFEDIRYELDFEQWRADKEAGMWGENPSLPMYIEDEEGAEEVKLTQSTAILEYLAVKHNVMPASAKEAYERTWYFETEHDFKSKKGWGTAMMQDEVEVTEMFGTINLRKEFMMKLEVRFADGREHAAGNSVTTADFALLTFYLSSVVNEHMRHALVREQLTERANALPNLMRVVNNIKAPLQATIDAMPATKI